MSDQESLGSRLDKLEARNQRVEGDKAWEISLTRRLTIIVITYLTVCFLPAFCRPYKPLDKRPSAGNRLYPVDTYPAAAKAALAGKTQVSSRVVSAFTFVTSNDHKVITAKAVCAQFGLSFSRKNMDLLEIQSASGEEIARFKVEQAYQAVQGPVTVTDDSWLIPGLNGFPGPYMKYMNQWFKPEDFIRLTKDLSDRRVFMRHIIAYKDKKREKVFTVDIEALMLDEARGNSVIPHFAFISLDGGKTSVAESEAAGNIAVADQANAWHAFCSWFNK